MNDRANVDPEALSIPETCRVTSLGRTTVYDLIGQGVLPARKVGARTIILRADVQRFLENLPVVK